MMYLKVNLPSPHYIQSLSQTVDFLMELNKMLQDILTHLDSSNITSINTDLTALSSRNENLTINQSRISVKSENGRQIADISPEGCTLSDVNAQGKWNFENVNAEGLSASHNHGIPHGAKVKVLLPGSSSETYMTFNS